MRCFFNSLLITAAVAAALSFSAAGYAADKPGQADLDQATDLQITVVYRGAMGSEADEIAVGSVDVFEPTYIAIYNSTDQLLFNGVWTDTTSPSGLTVPTTLQVTADRVIE